MKELGDLERMGFTFELDGDAVRYAHQGPRPASEAVRPLLEALRSRRGDVVQHLQERERAEEEAAAVPICDQAPETEDAWWAKVFGDRGIPDPADQVALEAAYSAAIDASLADPDPAHQAQHAYRIAEAAILLGLPCYADDMTTDLGAAGWREWAASCGAAKMEQP